MIRLGYARMRVKTAYHISLSVSFSMNLTFFPFSDEKNHGDTANPRRQNFLWGQSLTERALERFWQC